MLRPVTPRQSFPLFDTRALRQVETDAASNLPENALMQRAGVAVARLVQARFPHARRIVALAGAGNNGGDGLIAACHLHRAGREVVVAACGAESPDEWIARLPPDAAWAWSEVRATGLAAECLAAQAPLPPADLYLDALLGIGLKGPVRPEMEAVIASLNAQTAAPVLSVDCPSGLDIDRGVMAGAIVRATVTLSLLGLKPGLCTGPDAPACGELWTDDLDAFPSGVEASPAAQATATLLGADSVRPLLPDLVRAAHKGRRGDVRIIGGAAGMGGAALLAARSAAMLGAGRVFVGLIDPKAPVVDANAPELMLRPVHDLLAPDAAGNAVRGAVLFGPGAGTDAPTRQWLLRAIGQSLPLVLDADGLNLLAQRDGHAEIAAFLRQRRAPTILTPHPLEAARLLACSAQDVQADRVPAARELARRFHAWVVLKGAGTVIASPAQTVWINPTGNGLLATAGSGDVLAGAIAGLIGATGTPESVLAAVWLHGCAADHYAAHNGPGGLTAGRLPEWMATCWADRLAAFTR